MSIAQNQFSLLVVIVSHISLANSHYPIFSLRFWVRLLQQSHMVRFRMDMSPSQDQYDARRYMSELLGREYFHALDLGDGQMRTIKWASQKMKLTLRIRHLKRWILVTLLEPKTALNPAFLGDFSGKRANYILFLLYPFKLSSWSLAT